MASHDPLNTVDGALVVGQLTEEEQAERRAAAVRYLTKRGAADLIDVLGLGDEEPGRPAPVPPSSVPCPQCRAGAGETCISAKSGMPWNGYHTARRRKAQERKEVAA